MMRWFATWRQLNDSNKAGIKDSLGSFKSG